MIGYFIASTYPYRVLAIKYPIILWGNYGNKKGAISITQFWVLVKSVKLWRVRHMQLFR